MSATTTAASREAYRQGDGEFGTQPHEDSGIVTIPGARPALLGPDAFTVDYSLLPPKQASQVRRELDGPSYGIGQSLGTLVERCVTKGTTGKDSIYLPADSKPLYRIRLADGNSCSVSKTTYDALTGIPELMTDLDKTRFEVGRLNANMCGVLARNFYRPLDRMPVKDQQLLAQIKTQMAKVKEDAGRAACAGCAADIYPDGHGSWVDDTDGDACLQDSADTEVHHP